jgi:hypothetical protein
MNLDKIHDRINYSLQLKTCPFDERTVGAPVERCECERVFAGWIHGHSANEKVVEARHQCGREYSVRVARPETPVGAEAASKQLPLRRTLVAGRELQRLVRANTWTEGSCSHASTCKIVIIIW